MRTNFRRHIEVRDFDRLRLAVASEGLSGRALAQELELSTTHVGQVLTGARHPSARVARLIARRVKRPFDDLFVVTGGEDDARKRVAGDDVQADSANA